MPIDRKPRNNDGSKTVCSCGKKNYKKGKNYIFALFKVDC